ncbi:hypothetical protein HOY82DRAFT_607878 [Tuber indicum]|nr:hypothetical protein HOY82DRAFT_607878 [Tuber indicum]
MRKFNLVSGVPNKESLMLNFKKVFLCPHVQGKGQPEWDITFFPEELEEYANHVWAHANDAKIRSKHSVQTHLAIPDGQNPGILSGSVGNPA